jgi:hypothetical protein
MTQRIEQVFVAGRLMAMDLLEIEPTPPSPLVLRKFFNVKDL